MCSAFCSCIPTHFSNITRIFSAVLCAVQSGGSNGGASGNSLGDSNNGTPSQQQQQPPPQQPRGPHFDTSASKNITALLGKTAYLNCRVKNLSNKTVSYHISHFSGSELQFSYCDKWELLLVATNKCFLYCGKIFATFAIYNYKLAAYEIYNTMHNTRSAWERQELKNEASEARPAIKSVYWLSCAGYGTPFTTYKDWWRTDSLFFLHPTYAAALERLQISWVFLYLYS